MKIPEIILTPTAKSEEGKNAIGFKWNDIVGFRHKLGGEADGIPLSNYPKCKECENQMTFYAQIDSIGDDYNLADCMVIHQFVCFDCFTVESQLNQI